MTTLAEITLKVAKKITNVFEGTATDGTATSLTDAALNQSNQYWENGTLWILSEHQVGKVTQVSAFSSNVLTFPTVGGVVGTARYAVTRSIIPWVILKQSVNAALDEIKIVAVDESLEAGDDEDVDLPDGVANVFAIEFDNKPCTHFEERDGRLYFQKAPSADEIRLLYRKAHDELVNASDEVSSQVNIQWLVWQSAVNALRWAMKQYQNDPAYKFDEFLNEALKKAETMRPFNNAVRVRVKTA